MDTTALSHLLWQLDPMGTCCNTNDDMDDEYWGLADAIQRRLQQGQAPRSAVIAEFDHSFWEGCLLSEQRRPLLEHIVDALQAASALAPQKTPTVDRQ